MCCSKIMKSAPKNVPITLYIIMACLMMDLCILILPVFVNHILSALTLK